MPELPEVETIRRDLEKEIVGHKITDLWYDAPKMLQPTPEKLETIVGHHIVSAGRIGKLLLLGIENDGTVGIHLKLSGRLFIRDQNSPEDRFTHVIFLLDDGRELRFTEFRKFGYAKLIEDEEELKTIKSKYGPEPLTSDFTFDALKKVLNKANRAVKTVIMDQKKIAGVGNIYADEALWLAKINPEALAFKLTNAEIEALHQGIIKVIEAGIADRGTSVDDYLDVYGKEGFHAKNLNVFRQNGKPCPRCGTMIKKIRVGGRGTHLCPNCQVKK
ncbi:MAG: DNA-formamidopyrimidine glycosylase [Candidatus Woykebacteria bacterium RIFCSPHIGHO2_12_FULL_45_10]|uniref:Formamidopyrimidine-DNA glycosylase n=1 Tax=Candidatus Woykebacteria bacterium RIFCSPHIGHO2_12_FULL_45_10 TaxID=1802603 RepID=A0A1G1WT45_9BACT|nr:MAG: DNA-formamidopyrimidine glycosylase [Candidatus Woykebacteria bacterium RIFCSPHIGHO2_12_FULL_45_10]